MQPAQNIGGFTQKMVQMPRGAEGICTFFWKKKIQKKQM
jgi:hypothetical protein